MIFLCQPCHNTSPDAKLFFHDTLTEHLEVARGACGWRQRAALVPRNGGGTWRVTHGHLILRPRPRPPAPTAAKPPCNKHHHHDDVLQVGYATKASPTPDAFAGPCCRIPTSRPHEQRACLRPNPPPRHRPAPDDRRAIHGGLLVRRRFLQGLLERIRYGVVLAGYAGFCPQLLLSVVRSPPSSSVSYPARSCVCVVCEGKEYINERLWPLSS